jgi:hypothetical protein
MRLTLGLRTVDVRAQPGLVALAEPVMTILTEPRSAVAFIRLAEDGSGNKIVDDGLFGLLPHFAAELAPGGVPMGMTPPEISDLF